MMKVLDPEPESLTAIPDIREESPVWQRFSAPVDLTRCTRCRQPWGYHLVENVEIWNCCSCGYEARERSTDYLRLLMAQRDSMVG
jgi:hypothetical protein